MKLHQAQEEYLELRQHDRSADLLQNGISHAMCSQHFVGIESLHKSCVVCYEKLR